jgi:hypothetical protein
MQKYLISNLFFLLALFFFSGNFIFYYWLHGDFERYLWIINQPWPLSHLGGSSVQLLIYIAFTFTALILLATGIYIQHLINKK